MSRFSVNGDEVFHKGYMSVEAGLDAGTLQGYTPDQLLPSDQKLKENVRPLTPQLDASQIADLLVSYQYKPGIMLNGERLRYGVIAQDLLNYFDLKSQVLENKLHGDITLGIDPISILFYFIGALSDEVVRLKQEVSILSQDSE